MRLCVLVLIAAVALCGACQQAQEQPPPVEKAPPAKPAFNVAATTWPAKTVASVTIVGAEALTDSGLPEGVQSIFELTVPMGIKEISAWAMDREYALTGPPVGVFPDDPNTVPEAEVRTEIQWEVAPPEEGELETTERIEVKTIDEMMVAAGMYHGSFEDPRYEKALAALMAWPEANGYQIVGPFTEVYHSDAASVPPAEWKTEIAMPVIPAPPAEGEEATGE